MRLPGSRRRSWPGNALGSSLPLELCGLGLLVLRDELRVGQLLDGDGVLDFFLAMLEGDRELVTFDGIDALRGRFLALANGGDFCLAVLAEVDHRTDRQRALIGLDHLPE